MMHHVISRRTRQGCSTCEVSSVVEHILHTDGVISSNLILRIPENLAEMQGFFVLIATK